MSCTNKLKQLAIASHNYHDTHDALHAFSINYTWIDAHKGSGDSSETMWGTYSGIVHIFPFLELDGQYNALKSLPRWEPLDASSLTNISNWEDGSVPGDPRFVVLPAFLCPSSGGQTKPDNVTTYTNYRMNVGDNAYVHANEDLRYFRGCFGFQSWLNLAALTDGTSNTLFFSERALSDSFEGTGTFVLQGKIKTNTVGTLTPGSGTPFTGTTITDTYLSSRAACMNMVSSGGEYNVQSRSIWGTNLWYGKHQQLAFHTILPPNGPATYSNDTAVVAPTSNHSGGVNASLADGSVRFISETIDTGTSDTWGGLEATGGSPFGVWGAMGSRNGGEAKSL
jgi:prepilin-type processing-associated H-X9-DG protein